MEKVVTIKRVLVKRYKKKQSNAFHLALRVTYEWIPVIFPIDEEVTEEDFKKLASPRYGEALAAIKNAWLDAEKRAEEIVKELGSVAFLAFQKKFYENHPSRQNRGRLKALRKVEAGMGQPVIDTPKEQPGVEGEGSAWSRQAFPGRDRFKKYVFTWVFDPYGRLCNC